jgi:hypothetical protein
MARRVVDRIENLIQQRQQNRIEEPPLRGSFFVPGQTRPAPTYGIRTSYLRQCAYFHRDA